jgi:hypothetical protein
MGDIPPDFVQEFLHYKQSIRAIDRQKKELAQKVKELTPQVGRWLGTVPGHEYPLHFIGENEQKFGTKGKLCVRVRKQYEYMNKTRMEAYLLSFFVNTMVEQDHDELRQLAHAAIEYIWKSKKLIKEEPYVTRTYTKK